MKITYADPPYLGCGKLYKNDHPDSFDFDDPKTYQNLIQYLEINSPEGWALSMSVPSLPILLPMIPTPFRLCAWVKPFCSFKPGVNPAYAWEPVVIRGGRKRTRQQPTVRDWVSANITLKKGLTGAKPINFCYWLFEILNLNAEDEFVDMFPGTGGVTKAFDEWLRTKA